MEESDKKESFNKKGQDEIHLALTAIGILSPNEEAFNERVFCDDSPYTIGLKQKLKRTEFLQWQSFFNEPFYESVYGVDQSKIKLQKKQTPKLKQSAFRSFFISIFRGLQEETRDKANQKPSTETYADPQRHLKKEITGQSNGKNRFADVSGVFRKIFSASLINDGFHDTTNVA